jgi:hypothetical protein
LPAPRFITVVLTLWQLVRTSMAEGRRSQPIIVTHEVNGLEFDPQPGVWVVRVEVKNEGTGPAFNVRFGVSFYGVRFAYRLNLEDPESGNRIRVLQPSEVRDGVVALSSSDIWAGRGRPMATAFYWARYETAQGTTWETHNPPERSADLDIRRVWLMRLRERVEVRRRKRLTREGEVLNEQIFNELKAARDAEEEAG